MDMNDNRKETDMYNYIIYQAPSLATPLFEADVIGKAQGKDTRDAILNYIAEMEVALGRKVKFEMAGHSAVKLEDGNYYAAR